MKKAYLLLVFLMPLSIAIHSCKPEKPATPDDNWPKEWYIPQEVLDYFYFNQGSYWVYENDKTGERDTLVLVQNGRGLTNATPQGERYEVAYTELVSKRDGFTYKYGINTQGSAGCIKGGSQRPCYGVTCYKYKIGNVIGEGMALILPFQKDYGGQANGSFTSIITMKDTLNKMTVGGKEFSDIVIVNIDPSITDNKKNFNYTWSKSVGLIKKENISNGETWKLIQYYVY